MINVRTFVFNPFRVNTYVVSDETGECIIIDPGCENAEEREELAREINRSALKPVKLVNTHCHVDHLLGNGFVKDTFSIPLLIHKLELPLLISSVEQGAFFGLATNRSPHPDIFLEEGDILNFGNSEFEVLHLPGHSPGSIAMLHRAGKIAIVGDVLFQGSIGRTDLPGGDYNMLIKNIKEKLLILNPDTTIYPGHGPVTNLDKEQRNNPFLI